MTPAKSFLTGRSVIHLCSSVIACLIFGLAPVSAWSQDDQPIQSKDLELTIGSTAPDIDIEHWISNNDGLFPEIKKFEQGNVYVLMFWRSNSPLSRAAMPVMSRLQTIYEVDDVQFIAVTKDRLETVDKFLQAGLRVDDQKISFEKVTNNFCLTADEDGSVFRDFCEASRQKATPVAMIIGRTRQIEWIGNPMSVEKPLDATIAGHWDRTKFKSTYEQELFARENRRSLERRLMSTLSRAHLMMRDGEEDKAFEFLKSTVEDKANKGIRRQLQELRIGLLIGRNHSGLAEGLSSYLEDTKAIAQVTPDITTDLNNYIWKIYERHKDKGDVADEVLKVSLEGAKFASEIQPESGVILDTYAHLIYIVEQDLDKAIKVQEEAVKKGGERAADLEPFLNQLKEEKKSGQKSEQKKSPTDEASSDF